MLRRRWLRWSLLLVLVTGATTAGIWWWMQALPPISTRIEPGKERSRKLLALAAREVAHISAVDVRLTRLLNLADRQIQRGWKDDARITLATTAESLRGNDAAALDEHARLSGWISISELSRACADLAGAGAACDGALAALRAIPDPARRCDYVIGICNELQYLKGKAAAARLVDEAGEWTRSIDHVTLRRQAVVGFASALFNLDEYDKGERMMRQEQDPAWSSQMLTQLAGMASPAPEPSFAVATQTPRAGAPAAVLPVHFGKHLSYDKVFQNQERPQTAKPPQAAER